MALMPMMNELLNGPAAIRQATVGVMAVVWWEIPGDGNGGAVVWISMGGSGRERLGGCGGIVNDGRLEMQTREVDELVDDMDGII